MGQEKLVSVIIPATSYDAFLMEAVNSVLQDGWNEIEVVVVLDGKKQAAPPWLHRKEVRLAWTGERVGSAAAINLGIELSRGDYIARLDADDVSLAGRFEKQLSFLEEHPEVVVVGGLAELIDDKGSRIGSYNSGVVTSNPRLTLLRRNPFIHSSFFLRRQQLLDIGLYDESCTRMQDYELLLRLAKVGQVAIIEEILVQYRVHHSQNSKHMTGFVSLMVKLSSRKRALARCLGKSVGLQLLYDLAYALAQYARYLGLRSPKYLKSVQSQ